MKPRVPLGRVMAVDYAIRTIHAHLRKGRCEVASTPRWLRRLMTRRLSAAAAPMKKER